MNPLYPLEITAFEPSLRLGISNDLPWGGGGGGDGYFLEPHIASFLLKTCFEVNLYMQWWCWVDDEVVAVKLILKRVLQTVTS